MKESDIMHENGDFWVLREKKHYNVLKSGHVASTSIVQYAPTADGLSLAIAYADYRAGRDA